jgi:hypothetical protein
MNNEQLRLAALEEVQQGLPGQGRQGRPRGLVSHGSAACAALVLAGLAAAGPALAAPTFLSSHAQAGVAARATWFTETPLITDTQRHDAASASEDYAVDATAYSVSQAWDAEAQLRMRVEVNGIGAELGQVVFRADYGGRNMLHGELEPLFGSGWFYRFSVDEDSDLTLRYDVGVDGQGVSGDVSLLEVHLNGAFKGTLNSGTPGTRAYHLEAGQTYWLDIRTSFPVLKREVYGDVLGGYYGLVEWAIEPSALPPTPTVPEPATGALAAAALLAAMLSTGRRWPHRRAIDR